MEESNALLVSPANRIRTPHPIVNPLTEARTSHHRAATRDRRYNLDLSLDLNRLHNNGLTSNLNRHFNRDDSLDNSLLTRNDDRNRLRGAACHQPGRE